VPFLDRPVYTLNLNWNRKFLADLYAKDEARFRTHSREIQECGEKCYL